ALTNVPYEIHVLPGNTFAAKGRPLTLTARVQPFDSACLLPSSSTLVVTDATGTTSRQRMLVEQPNQFSLRFDKVGGDFTYYVETGAAVSDLFNVTTVEPVELAAESPTITIVPPSYAQANVEPETRVG